MSEAPAQVTLLAIGGRRHGEEITVAADAPSWTDLLSAEVYYPARIPYVARNPVNPRAASA